MIYRTLGKSDLKASVIGLGTGQFGSRIWGYKQSFNDRDIINIIENALDAGVNVFDTAETYGYGVSERLLGRVLRRYRDDFIVISKVAPWNLRHHDVIRAASRSLKRLGLNDIDLYLVHYPNPFVPQRGTMAAMEKLIRLGKVRYIGVSNFNARMLRIAQEQLSHAEITANEIEYNVFCRRSERQTIPYCEANNTSIIAYRPLAGGILTDAYRNVHIRDRAKAFNFYARRSFLDRARKTFSVLEHIAKERQASISQIALAWILANGKRIAIPAALSAGQVNENGKATDVVLTDEDTMRIDRASVDLDSCTYLFDNYVIRPIAWVQEMVKCFRSSASMPDES